MNLYAQQFLAQVAKAKYGENTIVNEDADPLTM